MDLTELPTPSLVLDKIKLLANIARMQSRADHLGVKLRPHLKTLKAASAARLLIDSGASGITVSTLREAAYFFENEFTDITYAVGMVPSKLAEAGRLIKAGADLKIMTDNVDVARHIASQAGASGVCFKVLIEIDSGDHRGGVQVDSDELLTIVKILSDSSALFEGFLTHAGHSYDVNTTAALEQIAIQERDAVVKAASRARAAGFSVTTVSLGSTPTALYAQDLAGVTELRAGVYTVFDMDQQSRGVCETDEIAMAVLTTVIGHNQAAGKILLDAGGLALSKDRGADKFRPEVGYGQVCDSNGDLIDGLYVTSVSQEHGHVKVRDDNDYALFPVGSLLRVLPIHACMTAAAYEYFNIIEDTGVTGQWTRVNGW